MGLQPTNKVIGHIGLKLFKHPDHTVLCMLDHFDSIFGIFSSSRSCVGMNPPSAPEREFALKLAGFKRTLQTVNYPATVFKS